MKKIVLLLLVIIIIIFLSRCFMIYCGWYNNISDFNANEQEELLKEFNIELKDEMYISCFAQQTKLGPYFYLKIDGIKNANDLKFITESDKKIYDIEYREYENALRDLENNNLEMYPISEIARSTKIAILHFNNADIDYEEAIYIGKSSSGYYYVIKKEGIDNSELEKLLPYYSYH